MSSDPEAWIIVRNWDRFQYYSDRRPPWITNHVDLLHDHNYLALPPGTRAVLHGLWLEYCSSRARLRLDTASLSRRLAMRVTRAQLDTLVHAGFLEFSHAPCIQHASPRARPLDIDKDIKNLRSARKPEPRPAASAYQRNGNGHGDDEISPADRETALAFLEQLTGTKPPSPSAPYLPGLEP